MPITNEIYSKKISLGQKRSFWFKYRHFIYTNYESESSRFYNDVLYTDIKLILKPETLNYFKYICENIDRLNEHWLGQKKIYVCLLSHVKKI